MPVTCLHTHREPVSPWTLRIELLDVKPVVWRRLLAPAAKTRPIGFTADLSEP